MRFCWSQSNDYNDINIFMSLENSRAFFLAKEKNWKRIFKTNSESLQNHAEKQFVLSTSFFMIYVITTPQDGFIAPHVWEIVGTKNLTIFKGCQYFRFYMMISSNFWSIEQKNLNSNPCISITLYWEQHHLLHISYLNIRSGHEIEEDFFRFL